MAEPIFKVIVIPSHENKKIEQLHKYLGSLTHLGETQQVITRISKISDIFSIIKNSVENGIKLGIRSIEEGIQSETPLTHLIDQLKYFKAGTVIVEIISPPQRHKERKIFTPLFSLEYRARFYYTDKTYPFEAIPEIDEL